ncbi:MAG: L-2-hydroxyglutarate oxidase [Deltaproteobacteria bacterium]|nr:L-2-hydroxyglutarate oxidase [Deltaproteobacteria bacterium]
MPSTADFLVIGGGVVGLTTALALRGRHPDASVVVLEKEDHCGAHASGRNSGVLHAGFYYSADSLKARFSRDGCARWKAWCEERDLPVNACGKLVVARTEDDFPQMDELLRRAERNGVDLEEVSEADAHEIDPRAHTVERALWSPSTASVDPQAIMTALAQEAREAGIAVATGTAYRGVHGGSGPHRVGTSAGLVSAGFVVNAAGLHADRVARDFGFAEHYRILPFKGLYLYGDVPADWMRVHIYPVPDLEVPFLGVHFTVTVEGAISIGPTALPALWREQYGGLGGFSAKELAEVTARGAAMVLRDRGFRRLAIREGPKLLRSVLARRAAALVHDLDVSKWRRWGRPGIRAQLQDARSGALVTDFVTQGDPRSLHVLNAVSPAFTCALPFAEYLAEEVDDLVE